jgi:hypothetical protein
MDENQNGYLRLLTFLQYIRRYPGYWLLGLTWDAVNCRSVFSGEILCRYNALRAETIFSGLDPAEERNATALCKIMNCLLGEETLYNAQSTLRRLG